MLTAALRFLAACVVLLASFHAQATVYRMQLVAGDTVGVVSLNDAGTLVLGGFSDFQCADRVGEESMSALLRPPYLHVLEAQFVPSFPTAGRDTCGVNVLRINSAGDMIGTTDRNGVRIPTFWRDGMPHDLRDSANAGLVFVPDPGVQRVPFDIHSFDVINLPDFPFLGPPDDWNLIFPATALTNAGGLFAITLTTLGGPQRDALLLPVAVAEPASLPLALIGLAVMAAATFRRAMPAN